MMRLLIPFLLLVLLVVFAVVFVRQFRGSGRPSAPTATGTLPFRKKDYLLSMAERSFFEALSNAVGHQYFVFPKVRLADLVYLPRDTENRQAHFNRVVSKHVDFVLCDPVQLKPLMVVELDDALHESEDRQERDAFVDAALDAAGLAMLHVPAQRAYPQKELAELVGRKLAEQLKDKA